MTRRGKKFSACSSLGGGSSSPDEKVDRGWMDGEKEERFREESCGRGTLCGRCSPFFEWWRFIWNLEFEGVAERLLFIYLFVCSKGDRSLGYFEMIDEMGRERITRNY